MYWSWQVLHADCIVYDSIITPHAFPTGWLINAIDYLQHWWQEGIIALLFSKLFVFPVCMHACVCMCVCFTRTQAHMKIYLYIGGKGGINQKKRKRKLRTQRTLMSIIVFSTCFLMLPNRWLVLYLNYSFTFYSQIFTEHQTLARHNVFLNL